MRKPSELAQVAEQIQTILKPLNPSEQLTVIIMVGCSMDEDEDDDPEADEYQEDVKDETGQYEVSGGIPDLRAIEVESIRRALKRNEGNTRATAQDLHISERTLCRKMKQYEIQL